MQINMESNYVSPQSKILLGPIIKRDQVSLYNGKHTSNNNNKNFFNFNMSKELTEFPNNVEGMLKYINDGYLEFIDAIERNNMNLKHSLEHRDRKMFNTGNSTAKNISDQTDDLQKKIILIKEDNDRLKGLLDLNLISQSKVLIAPPENEKQEVFLRYTSHPKYSKKFSTSLSNTKLFEREDLLNVEKLKEISKKLESKINLLGQSVIHKLERKEKEKELKEYLFQEEKKKEKMEDYNIYLKDILGEKSHQIQTLKEHFKDHYPNVESSSESCTSDNCSRFKDPLYSLLKQGIFDSDEPKDCKQANSCIMFLNQFDEQFEQKNYKVAAHLAAISPNGILRNYRTFLSFKNANNSWNGCIGSSPLFLFCEALMNTSYADGVLSEKMSVEIIRCATFHADIGLIKHWLKNTIISSSISLGNFLMSCCKCINKCLCGWTYLALEVYLKRKDYKAITLCHLKLNNYTHAISYIKQHNFSVEDYKELLSNYPDIQLSYLLSDALHLKTSITLPCIISTYMYKKMYNSIIQLLSQVYDNGLHGKTLLDCLLNETSSDDMGEEKWQNAINICHSNGNDLIAEELYSCLCTRQSLDNATTFCLCDYIS